jgi:tetratricopeptide (TPR) repeat protein
MARAGAPPSLRVERALRLLPDTEDLSRVRALISAASRALPDRGPYDILGKRLVDPAALRLLVPRIAQQAAAALSAAFHASIDVLELEQSKDRSGAIQGLLEAGMAEEQVGRYGPARAWFECALRESEELRDRVPKTQALRSLGRVALERGRFEEASRFLSDSLMLAEADRNPEVAGLVCRDLGNLEARRLDWDRADAWYRRGTYFPHVSPSLLVLLYLGMADAARERKDFPTAGEILRSVLDSSRQLGDPVITVLCLTASGRLEASRGRHPAALSLYRKALESANATLLSPPHEMDVRLDICRLWLVWRELPQAADELLHAEDFAVRNGLRDQLIRLYQVMGMASGRDRAETGFVYFETAIELCRGLEPLPWLEAEIYQEYGLFRSQLGDPDEARAYLGRALEIQRTIGDGPMLTRIESRLAQLHGAEA